MGEENNSSTASSAVSAGTGSDEGPATYVMPWRWQGDAIVTADGRIVLYPRAESACGRAGDEYYSCRPPSPKVDLYCIPERRAFIVTACNAHDGLVEALTKAAKQFEFYAREHWNKHSAALFNGMESAAQSARHKAEANELHAHMCRDSIAIAQAAAVAKPRPGKG